MLVTISPAKTLDWSPVERDDLTEPEFAGDAIRLSKTMRNLTLKDLQKLMDLSPALARLNRDRFRAYSAAPGADDVRPAALAFAGDTYQGLEATSLSDDELRYAQDYLRILSGLYGALRPLDQIQAYRLEMGSRLKTRRGKSLYDYWGNTIAKSLNAQAAETDSAYLLNCASQEYFGAVPLAALKPEVVTPVFLEDRGGTAKTVSFFAKRARGAMARLVVQNRIRNPKDLKDFDLGGYSFQADQSDTNRLVFQRPYPVATAAA